MRFLIALNTGSPFLRLAWRSVWPRCVLCCLWSFLLRGAWGGGQGKGTGTGAQQADSTLSSQARLQVGVTWGHCKRARGRPRGTRMWGWGRTAHALIVRVHDLGSCDRDDGQATSMSRGQDPVPLESQLLHAGKGKAGVGVGGSVARFIVREHNIHPDRWPHRLPPPGAWKGNTHPQPAGAAVCPPSLLLEPH